jgi:hypothetical protein
MLESRGSRSANRAIAGVREIDKGVVCINRTNGNRRQSYGQQNQ